MISLDQISRLVREKVSLDDRRGIFCSFFRGTQLLTSQWVVFTDKPLRDIIETLYQWLWLDHAKLADRVAVDVVIDWTQQTSLNTILDLDLSLYGLCVATQDHSVSATMLPKTVWVTNVKIAVNAMKQKYPQLTGSINIYTFTTERLSV